ncbi:FliM/FliN family flagellar motor C-terminal domain-containing protein [Sphingomonas sp. DT-204]|uniref:FliM/FliN family flagellar motor switch protein n=1 Tax=Sphingomonas sp. DT-204 TaxID=3396166 RepID=UPI003F1D5DB0
MASAALDALTELPAVDPDAAALGQVLCTLIGSADLDAAVVRRPQAAHWFVTADGLRFTLLRCEGRRALLDEARVGDAVALLDRAEPVLAALEAALELPLEPEALAPDQPERAVLVSFAREGTSGLVAVPPDHPARAGWEERARAVVPPADALPVVLRCLVQGPRLSVAEAGGLGGGDLVLVDARPCTRIERGDGGIVAGQLDLASGLFALHVHGGSMSESDSPSPGRASDFAVPLSIRLPDRMTSAATLAALRPGTTLPLGPFTDGLAVELLVADRLLAKGELVRLGDRFAVLIEERADLVDVEPAEPETETGA